MGEAWGSVGVVGGPVCGAAAAGAGKAAPLRADWLAGTGKVSNQGVFLSPPGWLTLPDYKAAKPADADALGPSGR